MPSNVRAVLLFLLISSTIVYLKLYGHPTTSILPPARIETEQDEYAIAQDENETEPLSAEMFYESAIDSDFDPVAFQELCANKKWNEDLIIQCAAPQGGIGNVRNVFLTCVRYTIEAGGAFIVPKIVARDEQDLSNLGTQNLVPFDYFFDLAHFITSLIISCPQMKVYGDLESTPNYNASSEIPFLPPQDLTTEFVAETVLAHPEEWRGAFDTWLLEHFPSDSPKPSIVGLSTPLLQFPLSYDTKAFTDNFGRILSFKESIRSLAAAAMLNLTLTHNLDIPPEGIAEQAYLGAHLRTAPDATAAGWASYQAQADFYLATAEKLGLPLIYVTSESEPSRAFVADAENRELKVVMKENLLSEGDKAELAKLTWDQQALVDYEILLRSSFFVGIDSSSFAWNIALRRHVLSDEESLLQAEEGVNMRDEFSALMGMTGNFEKFSASMWP